MKIGISSDHRGYELKEELTNILEENGYNIIDYGTYSNESVDYPVYAFKLCEAVISKQIDFGISICGTGIGMSIACNKVKGIRCAKIDNIEDAEYAKVHNNANVISISAKKSIGELTNMLDKFINSKFDTDEKYSRRIKAVEDYENEH